ncbi:MAG: PAS domain-containing protein, partial [Deltaproteobacteria bacterium]|nr:PAS domain-containing protein [Deltaproteobacteria bacterium]
MFPEEINLETYLSHLRNPVVLVRPDGSILHANASFCGLFGHQAGLNGANLSDLLKENPVILESTRRVAEIRGIYYLREISVKGPAQPERVMDVETFPIIAGSGEMLAVGVVFYDRAVRTQLHEHEKRTERINYFGMIASGLAHEIKNPLSGIKGASQLLAEELGNKKQLREYAEIILNEVVRVDRLLKDLLNFTKPRKLHKKKVNVNQVLHDQVLLQKTVDQNGIDIVAEFDPSLPKIMADPEALTQVFLNLIKNSRQSIR